MASRNQGKRNRERGEEFERECVRELHALGFTTARRTGSIQASGSGINDIAGFPGIWVSAKRWARKHRPLAFWSDAEARCPKDQIIMIIDRGDNKPATVQVRLADLVTLVERLNDTLAISRRLEE